MLLYLCFCIGQLTVPHCPRSDLYDVRTLCKSTESCSGAAFVCSYEIQLKSLHFFVHPVFSRVVMCNGSYCMELVFRHHGVYHEQNHQHLITTTKRAVPNCTSKRSLQVFIIRRKSQVFRACHTCQPPNHVLSHEDITVFQGELSVAAFWNYHFLQEKLIGNALVRYAFQKRERLLLCSCHPNPFPASSYSWPSILQQWKVIQHLHFPFLELISSFGGQVSAQARETLCQPACEIF